MNKKTKFSISSINSLLLIAFLLIVTSVISLWAYFYIDKVTDKNIRDYFNQSYNLTNLVIDNEQKYLNDTSDEVANLIYSKNLLNDYEKIEEELNTISSIEKIDLLFLKTNDKVYDYSYSLFDSEKLIEKLLKKSIPFNNLIVSVEIDSESYPMLLSQKKIEDKNTGRIKDILFVGKILNDNFSFVSNIKQKAKLKDIYIFYKDSLIVTTASNSEFKLSDLGNKDLLKKENYIYFKKDKSVYLDEKLEFILVSENSSFNLLKDTFIKQAISLVFVILLVFLLFYLITNRFIIKPFTRLNSFAHLIKDDKNVYFEKTDIYEFDDLADNLKRVIDELRDVKEQYTTAIEGVQDALWDVDLKHKKVHFSNRFKEMLGYKKDYNIDRLSFWFKNIYKKDYEGTIKKLREHLDKKSELFETDYRFRCKDGSFKWIRVRGKVFFDENGMASRISGFHTDIDAFIQLQNENKQKEDMLHQQSKLAAMGEMIGNIAHQWRQPLTVISVTASMVSMQLEEKDTNKKECIKDLEKLVTTVQYLSSIIEKFMHFFNPHSKTEIFSIKEAIEENLEIFEVSYKMNDIELILDLNDEEILGNKFELMQVVINIINNAKDALLKNDGDRFIFMCTSKQFDSLVIRIYDNAGGIPEDLSSRIYEPYFTTKHKSQGTGLGLYMSNEIIVKNFDGTITNQTKNFNFRNKNYKGEEFVIKIPL